MAAVSPVQLQASCLCPKEATGRSRDHIQIDTQIILYEPS